MGLRGVSPEKVVKRLKALFYGNAGVGKTTAAINFPKPYLIDTEKGATNDQYVETLRKSEGAIFQTTDFDEMIKEIKALRSEKHEFKTLIIDPMTMLYNDLLDKSAIKVGTEFGKHYNEANKKMKNLVNILLNLDMNVIITAHSKNEYGNNMAVLGQTFDCYKKLDFLFDLVFEIKKMGKERVGVIKKSRIETFPDGETFPFSYPEIAKRYGIDILEKEAVSESLANIEQVSELIRLIDLIKVPEETYQKWLDKNNAETFNDMTEECIKKCIEYLNSKIKGDK
jgi:hypothetical protein